MRLILKEHSARLRAALTEYDSSCAAVAPAARALRDMADRPFDRSNSYE